MLRRICAEFAKMARRICKSRTQNLQFFWCRILMSYMLLTSAIILYMDFKQWLSPILIYGPHSKISKSLSPFNTYRGYPIMSQYYDNKFQIQIMPKLQRTVSCPKTVEDPLQKFHKNPSTTCWAIVIRGVHTKDWHGDGDCGNTAVTGINVAVIPRGWG